MNDFNCFEKINLKFFALKTKCLFRKNARIKVKKNAVKLLKKILILKKLTKIKKIDRFTKVTSNPVIRYLKTSSLYRLK
jgi:hypothetical protein